jgi:copper chaperone NosL
MKAQDRLKVLARGVLFAALLMTLFPGVITVCSLNPPHFPPMWIQDHRAWADEKKPVQPSPKDKCPVCGMFVAKYPDSLAQVTFKDGSCAFFDGMKDLFKYYFNLKKYNPGKQREDIDTISVKDYYRLALINGTKALYVVGSDVYGPMGRELIPFETEGDAKEFMKDHKGKLLLGFGEVTYEIVKGLD